MLLKKGAENPKNLLLVNVIFNNFEKLHAIYFGKIVGSYFGLIGMATG